jgi:dTDP-4-amino-4,6-dideoxy-D-galactose acyltransferase
MSAEEMQKDPCALLPWDTDFFGFRVARVAADTLTPALCGQIDAWCGQNQIDCLYFIGRSDDPETTQLAERNQYHLVDIRVMMERDIQRSENPSAIVTRAATPADLPVMREIAATSFRSARFHQDPRIPREKADALYVRWIEADLGGRADVVLVTGDGDQLRGYLSCYSHRDGDTASGGFGIMGVHPKYRGLGVARGLVDAALNWFAERGTTRVSFPTQARNITTQRVFQRAGFLTYDVRLVYHKWFT